jgi:Kef-type K+ transport system membrane component KefB
VDDVAFANLFGVCLVAFLVPFTLAFFPKIRLPAIVVELLVGIVLGPSVLGLLRVDDTVNVIAVLGLSYLLFLAGLDLDMTILRGATLRAAATGFAASLGIATVIGAVFHETGLVIDPMLIAVILSATGLGVVLPVLRGAGQVDTSFGRTVISNATIAEFATIVLLALLFSTSGMSPMAEGALLLVLGLLAALLLIGLSRLRDVLSAGDVLHRMAEASSQLRVRLAFALLIGLLAISERFGFEAILGAFVAGVILNVLEFGEGEEGRLFTAKLEAVGFGFLIPVFFVTSGLRLDLRGLLEDPAALVRVPLFLLALLVVRGAPAYLAVRTLGPRATAAAALLQATSLPFIVTATQIGVATGLMSPVTAAALVCAGLLSVLVFPAVALVLLRQPAADRSGRAVPQRPSRR